MLSLNTNLAARTQVQVLPEAKKAAVQSDEAKVSAPDEAKPGVSVTISGAAMKAAAAQKTSNSDIDDSGLAENVKNLLKMIRKLQQQLAEKRAELQAVMSDKRLSPEQLQARVSALQSEIAGLSAGLNSANSSLIKALKDLSSDQAMDVAKLLSSG